MGPAFARSAPGPTSSEPVKAAAAESSNTAHCAASGLRLIGDGVCVTGLRSGLTGETAVASCLLVLRGSRQAGPPPVDLNQAWLQ